jgi:hypothetical protein
MISRHHLSRNTVSAFYWCNKCSKQTEHRVDGGKKGPCLACLEKRGAPKTKPQQPAEVQERLF